MIHILSLLWNLRPLAAALVVVVVDFGMVCLLMCLEGRPPWQRTLYKTFVYNDTVFIPLYIAMAVVVMQPVKAASTFYTFPRWHMGLLVVGFVVSFLIEYIAVKRGQFTVSQELSPSKLWHTFIFAIIFYWSLSSLVLVAVIHRPLWAMGLIALSFLGFVYTCYLDLILPWPKDAHLEGTYIPWKWQVRGQQEIAQDSREVIRQNLHQDEDTYRGVVIEESLQSKDILRKLKIVSTKVEQVTEKHHTPWLQQWTLHAIEVPSSQAEGVAATLSKVLDYSHGGAWYADFKNTTHHYIIFLDKVFSIDRQSKQQYDEAKRYGMSLGIPEYQVDFHPEVKTWER